MTALPVKTSCESEPYSTLACNQCSQRFPGYPRLPVTTQVNSWQALGKLSLRKQFVRRRRESILLEWRKLFCGIMIVILPTSLIAQDSARAMLHDDGGVWLNGSPAPNSSAIFLHDSVQTQKGSLAKIDADGSTAMVQPDTIVQFDGNELDLDHGSLQLNTSRGMRVRVNCMTVIPLTQEWTRYDVIDVDGRMTVEAHQNDVKIHYEGAVARSSKTAFSDVVVHQGEQVTREERCREPANPIQGTMLDSPWAVGIGAAAIGIITCWALCRGGAPVSPSKP
jgi:hypothetical protein